MFDDQSTNTGNSVRAGRNGGTLVPFSKGISGNPSGRPKTEREVKALAQKSSKAAMLKLISLIEDEDPRVALTAANAVLERAFGKVAPAKDAEEANNKAITVNIVRYADQHQSAPQLESQTVSVRTLAVP